MIKYLKNKLNEHQFLQRVSVLVGGTAIGQLIAILSLPILTRIYGPEAFSTLAVYVSLLTIMASVAGLCFEYAIPLPKSNRLAASLTALALSSVFFVTLIAALIVLVFPSFLNAITKGKLTGYLWLIPLGVMLVGTYNTLQYWSTRNKRFVLIAKTRVTQSLSGTAIKLGAGYLTSGWPAGLILGQMISQGAGSISLGLSLLKNDRKYFKGIKCRYLKIAFARYKEFPRFATLEVFANNGNIQIPIILIAYFSIGAEAGHLMIAMQLLSIPMSLIGGAVAQVYLAEGAERYQSGELSIFTKVTIKNLAKISFFPLILVGALSPFLIEFFLGDAWKKTGVLISWMVPWFFMQFITSPVSTALYITNNQKAAFYLQLFGLFLRVGAVYAAGLYVEGLIGEIYAISGFVFYTIYLLVIINMINKSVSDE